MQDGLYYEQLAHAVKQELKGVTNDALKKALRDIVHAADLVAMILDYDLMAAQVNRLGMFLVERAPGAMSQHEGAVDTAIRLLGGVYTERQAQVPIEIHADMVFHKAETEVETHGE